MLVSCIAPSFLLQLNNGSGPVISRIAYSALLIHSEDDSTVQLVTVINTEQADTRLMNLTCNRISVGTLPVFLIPFKKSLSRFAESWIFERPFRLSRWAVVKVICMLGTEFSWSAYLRYTKQQKEATLLLFCSFKMAWFAAEKRSQFQRQTSLPKTF